MSNVNIRIADQSDVLSIHRLMYEAFTPLRELGIDWPSVNATEEMVADNIQHNTTFVLELNDTIISTITVRYPWGVSEVFQVIRSFGGLQHNQNLMDKVMVVNY